MTTLPLSIHYQPLPLRLFNRVSRALRPIGLLQIDLGRKSLEAAARKATGLDSFGMEKCSEQFDVLLRSVEEEANLNPFGRFILRMDLVRILKGRLEAEALWKGHPEILEAPITDPVVIAGLPRTGTTVLHRLLGCDESFQVLHSWESLYPIPTAAAFRARASGAVDPRIVETERGIKAMLYLSPQLQQVHPMIAEEPEEELGLLVHSFASMLWEVIRQLPSFSAYIASHDQTFSYRYMVKQLQTVQWFRGSTGKRWILKSPQHVQDIACLLAVFPDAKVISTHRAPERSVVSTCSLAWCASVRDNDALGPEAIGAEWRQKIEAYARRFLAVRENAKPSHFVDILYRDIAEDPLRVVDTVYRAIGRELSDSARVAMNRWIAGSRQNWQNKHDYSPGQFGLEAAAIREQYCFLTERFGIPDEP